MEIEFQDLGFIVNSYFSKEKKKSILRSINGKFNSGQLCAIIGSSGAGKTSLLHILSGYKSSGITGNLLVNGQIRNEAWFRRRSCYITQEDHLPACMTVDEAMLMVTKLKLRDGKKMGGAIIDEILSYLGLETVRDVKTEHLSGGQKKRLSIALELVANPPVFFLDEPTSGLDDVSAKNTILLLRRLADEGRTVLCTIHQPSASMLKIFDKVYVVAKGQCVFQGAPNAIVPFLRENGFECPTSYNPADYLIELVDSEINIITLSTSIRNGKINEIYPKKTIFENNHNETKQQQQPETSKQAPNARLLHKSSWIKLKKDYMDDVAFAISGWKQFSILFQRFFRQSINNRKAVTLQLIHYIFTGLIVGAAFYGNGDDGSMMYNHLKFAVGVMLFYFHTRLFIPIILFPSEIRAAKREHFNRWYGLFPYYMATTLASIPTHIFFNCCYFFSVYYLTGLPREVWRFLMYVLITNLVAFSTEGIGLAIGAIFNELNGSVVGPALTAPYLGLAVYGFDFAKSIPLFMKILMKTSPMRCGLEAFIVVTFGFNRKTMQCDDLYCHFADPQKILNFLDATNELLYIDLGALVFTILFFRIVAYLSLRYRFAT